jgi:hypothetical protein
LSGCRDFGGETVRANYPVQASNIIAFAMATGSW